MIYGCDATKTYWVFKKQGPLICSAKSSYSNRRRVNRGAENCTRYVIS